MLSRFLNEFMLIYKSIIYFEWSSDEMLCNGLWEICFFEMKKDSITLAQYYTAGFMSFEIAKLSSIDDAHWVYFLWIQDNSNWRNYQQNRAWYSFDPSNQKSKTTRENHQHCHNMSYTYRNHSHTPHPVCQNLPTPTLSECFQKNYFFWVDCSPNSICRIYIPTILILLMASHIRFTTFSMMSHYGKEHTGKKNSLKSKEITQQSIFCPLGPAVKPCLISNWKASTRRKHSHRRNVTSYHSFSLLWLFQLL